MSMDYSSLQPEAFDYLLNRRKGNPDPGSPPSTIQGIQTGTVSLDPGSIGAQTRGSVTFNLPGAAPGDIVILQPPTGLNAGLAYAGARVTAANTVSVFIANITGVSIDDGAQTWEYLWFDVA